MLLIASPASHSLPCIRLLAPGGGDLLSISRHADSDQAAWQRRQPDHAGLCPRRRSPEPGHCSLHPESRYRLQFLGTPGHVEGTVRQAGTLRGVDHFSRPKRPGIFTTSTIFPSKVVAVILAPGRPDALADKFAHCATPIAIAQFCPSISG